MVGSPPWASRGASAAWGPTRFGQRQQDYPLAGIVVCLLALTLTLLPFLLSR
jgi:hypothetical protein